MIRRILKLSFFFTALVILILLISLAFDKQKIVSSINKKVNKFNLVLKFDEDIKISLFPFQN